MTDGKSNQVPPDGVDRDGGGESGHGAQAGRDTGTKCLSRLKPSVPIHFPIPCRLGLRPGWLGLRPGWLVFGPAKKGGEDEQMDGQTDGQTENIPIL